MFGANGHIASFVISSLIFFSAIFVFLGTVRIVAQIWIDLINLFVGVNDDAQRRPDGNQSSPANPT